MLWSWKWCGFFEVARLRVLPQFFAIEILAISFVTLEIPYPYREGIELVWTARAVLSWLWVWHVLWEVSITLRFSSSCVPVNIKLLLTPGPASDFSKFSSGELNICSYKQHWEECGQQYLRKSSPCFVSQRIPGCLHTERPFKFAGIASLSHKHKFLCESN